MSLQKGRPYPQGATWDGNGVNFALASEDASAVRLCLFDETGTRETAVIELPSRTGSIWHGYAPGIAPGQRYGYRVSGPYLPDAGLRFNPAKLLVDPYARALDRTIDWSAAVYGYAPSDLDEDQAPDHRDDAAGVPKGIVIDDRFDWEGDVAPRTPWERTVIYELHVKGMTARHPEVPEEQRGTYVGLASPAIVAYLKHLGVTAVELLPVHTGVDDRFLVERGLRNYWGYSTLGFFAPDLRYAVGHHGERAVTEFKSMVKTLHRAGIEVILDVVYNHSCESNHLGPTLSMRGIDNRTYYRLMPNYPRFYEDLTGTGNTLNVSHPHVLRLVMDSLRYWVDEMRVDGFRFDLTPVLGRDPHAFDCGASFFDAVHQDPSLAKVKLIAEPWDLGPYGYQLGNFPPGWSEWNDRFRDTMRATWLGHRFGTEEFAQRFIGSPDIFAPTNRGPSASINFLTAHDGFTLRDLVSYMSKHNEANGEQNRDGSDHNLSENFGVEGATDDMAIRERRLRYMRNLLATLLLSNGVPMICAGDERGRTQSGNNNAYCQDNEVSWICWDDSDAEAESLTLFVQRILTLRSDVMRLFGSQSEDTLTDLKMGWVSSSGNQLPETHWQDVSLKSFALSLSAGPGLWPPILNSESLAEVLIIFNLDDRAIRFMIPGESGAGQRWRTIADTRQADGAPSSIELVDRQLAVGAESVVVLGR